MKRALDLFCGGGGAAWGMMQAGFDVTGVDINSRNRVNYPGTFIAGDVLEFDKRWLEGFDLVWASPPCQAFTNTTRPERHVNLIPDTRAMLGGHPRTVIENVPGAPIRADVVLTGPSVGLRNLYRKRHFELSWWPGLMPKPTKPRRSITITTTTRAHPRSTRILLSPAEAADVMGVEHTMTGHQLGEAVPPAYAKLIAERA